MTGHAAPLRRARVVAMEESLATAREEAARLKAEAEEALSSGAVDMVGLARALVLDPALPGKWLRETGEEAVFPRFSSTPPGGVTAWYTERLHQWGTHGAADEGDSIEDALAQVERRKTANAALWQNHFQAEL